MLLKRLKIHVLVMALILTSISFPVKATVIYTDEEKSLEEYQDQLDTYNDVIGFSEYRDQYDSKALPSGEYIIEATDYSHIERMDERVISNHEGVAGDSLYTDEEGVVSWDVNVAQEGLYNIEIQYYPIEGKSAEIQRAVFVNGSLPFKEANNIEFSRIWVNDVLENMTDTQGNDIKPSQIEAPEWRTSLLKESQGYYTQPLQFHLNRGKNTISFVSLREPMVIRSIRIFNEVPTLSYQELLKEYEKNGYQPATKSLEKVEAEQADRKSSPMIYPVNDHSSPAVYPYSVKHIRNNTIGGTNWQTPGQWIEWDVNVPEDGLYKIAFNVKQNFVRGAKVYRKLTIDGTVPFKEAEALGFNFENSWRMETLGEEDGEYLFYLTEGVHTLRLEAVLGEYSTFARDIEDKIRELNGIYRQVNMITGIKPDKFRDYQIDRKIPNLVSILDEQRNDLYTIYEGLNSITGKKSSRDATIRTMAYQLDELHEDVERFTGSLELYKTTVGALGTWLMQVKDQPLQLDSIHILAPEESTPKLNDSIFARIKHAVLKLFYSFIIDYNAIGNVADEKSQRTITVWVGTGRDQANTMKTLIDESFTKNTGIDVNLMLVQMDTLLPATLAGQGPDVAMQVGGDTPMNYGIRGAVKDLSQFDDFEEVITPFNDSALVPFSFDGKYYALPETQTFFMLFYRKDILKEIGLEIPDTWSDVKTALSILSKNNMKFALPPVGIPTPSTPNLIPPDYNFGMFLFQNDGEFYNEDGSASALDTDVAINTFKEWTKYYTDFELEREFDFVNRFRTGEMPIGIADYTTYNTLQVFAPELKGLWGFTNVPGTIKEDGSINREVASGGSAVVMMNQTKDEEASWEFMKWWTSSDVQTKFGREMEALMGSAARYPTANMDSLDELPWPVEDYKVLKEQFKYVRGIPQVPGGYFTPRNINNAFYKVVVDKKIGPREALTDYVHYINEEINNKRKEFGLD